MGRYTNEDIPLDIPVKNMGDIPVIARLSDPLHGDEYWPATALKWTKTHVWVWIRVANPTTKQWQDESAWLRIEDVWRVLRPADIEAAAAPPKRTYGPGDGLPRYS